MQRTARHVLTMCDLSREEAARPPQLRQKMTEAVQTGQVMDILRVAAAMKESRRMSAQLKRYHEARDDSSLAL